MKFVCVLLLLLLCLVAFGPAGAASVDPGSVSAARVVQTAQPQVSAIPKVMVSMIPVQTTAALSPMLYVSSTPSGASVAVNGAARGTTPLTLGLSPGTYTVLVTLDGYRDYTATVTLAEGSRVAVDAQLQAAPGAGAVRENVRLVNTSMDQVQVNHSIVQGVSVNRTMGVTMTTPVPNTVCLSGQSCLTTDDAGVLFAPGWYYKTGEICGYAAGPGNQMIPKYCISGDLMQNHTNNCLSGQHCLTLEEAGDTLATGWYYIVSDTCGWEGTAYAPVPKYCISGSLKGSGLQAGAVQSIAAAGQLTRIPVSSETTLQIPGAVVTRNPPGAKRQVGIVDSVIGFFGGFFSRTTCPEGQAACHGTCTDLTIDPQNCGECDFVCDNNAVCIRGECTGGGYSQPPLS
jgi:hypothetical protein